MTPAEIALLRERTVNLRKWAHDIEEAVREPAHAVILEHEEATVLAALLRELDRLRRTNGP